MLDTALPLQELIVKLGHSRLDIMLAACFPRGSLKAGTYLPASRQVDSDEIQSSSLFSVHCTTPDGNYD